MPTPAEIMVQRLGGVTDAARALGMARRSIYRWLWPRAKGGTGGRIPTNKQRKVLAACAKAGRPMTSEEIVIGTPDV